MATIDLSRAQVGTLLAYANAQLAGGEPSLQESVGSGFLATFLFSFCLASKLSPGTVIPAAALTAATTEIKKMSYNQRKAARDAYQTWYTNMTNSNQLAIRIQPLDYTLIAEGTHFFKDVPNIVAVQNSSGNWIVQS